MELGAVRRHKNVFDVVLLANAFEVKIERVAFAESATFTMMTVRFVTPSILAALIRTNSSDKSTMLRKKN
jgi:hypothetical protein